jgi:hypothetical protein
MYRDSRLKGKRKFEKDTTVYDCVLAASDVEAWLLRIVSVSEGWRLLGSSAMYLHLKLFSWMYRSFSSFFICSQEFYKPMHYLHGYCMIWAIPSWYE